MKKYFFLLFIIVSLFLSCKKEKSEPCTPTNYTGMLPLHVGNKWVYRTTTYNHDSLGNITTNQTFDTLEIIGDTIIDCDTKYILKRTFNSYNMVFIFDGVILTLSNSSDGFNSSFERTYSYPYPVQPGRYTIISSNDNCTFYNYLSCDTLTYNNTLLNQSFFCYSYSLDSLYSCTGQYFLSSYYCYGIGLVVQKNYGNVEYWPSTNSHMQYPHPLYSTMELMSYTLY